MARSTGTPRWTGGRAWRCLYCGLLRMGRRRCLACGATQYVYGKDGDKDPLMLAFLARRRDKPTSRTGAAWLLCSARWTEQEGRRRASQVQPEQFTCIQWCGRLTDSTAVQTQAPIIGIVDFDGPSNSPTRLALPIVPSSTRINLRVPDDVYRAVQTRVRRLNEQDGGRRTVTAIVVNALNIYAGMPDATQEPDEDTNGRAISI